MFEHLETFALRPEAALACRAEGTGHRAVQCLSADCFAVADKRCDVRCRLIDYGGLYADFAFLDCGHGASVTLHLLQRSEPPLPLPFWILRLVAIRRFARPVVQDFRGVRENAVGKDRIYRQANRPHLRRSTDDRRLALWLSAYRAVLRKTCR